jgi:hypothetical protein
VRGYRAALADDDAEALRAALAPLDAELRGFAYEGAAMGVMLRDQLAPWRASRFARFVAGPGAEHVYMAHVGAGWALARLRRGPRAIGRLDALLGWLALDGYGFHQGYFRRRRPRAFTGYAARAFDQGLGRSLWFSRGARPEAIADAVARCDAGRRADLWSGVALAASYAGGAMVDVLERLLDAGRGYAPELAQGAAFAAAAREHAGNPAAHTELACRVFTGRTASEAAAITFDSAHDLPSGDREPAYEVWRSRIRARLAGSRPPARRPVA